MEELYAHCCRRSELEVIYVCHIHHWHLFVYIHITFIIDISSYIIILVNESLFDGLGTETYIC
jgi:hypothetical protein